ncbi:trk system potassium uptake protein TrkA [Melghirimyces thermohalophilus]|uniref:Trk system potassium uptake protein TrkA n=1 Tax=Melghirimyces thermohalophilus TaxID=1236220 RepID=A0A1G6I3Q7_9BACL|nr:cation:proton antiporter [Melghirimyces thermohalophilus]SDC01124.1 trk system potassium uptake protein TrkA [Melghirimyces thermohalophilus]
MEGNSITSLMIVVIAAFLIPILLHRLRWTAIPVVVAEIAVGVVLGESGLKIIEETEMLELLSNLGIIYLMFLTGLEVDFDLIQKTRKNKQKGSVNPLFISLAGFGAIFIASLLFAWGLSLLGYVKDVFFMTLIISTISVSVTMPVLKDKGLLQNPLGQSILLTAVVADFFTMMMLAVHVSIRRAGQGSDGFSSILLLFLLFVVFFVVYRLLVAAKPRRLMKKIQRETISIGTRGVFALILFFVALSEGVGAENILGAFLAGVILSLLSPEKGFVKQLNAFGFGFLIPIFFVMVGVRLDLLGMVQDPKALAMFPLLLIAFYLSKLVMTLFFRRYFSWKKSIASSLLLGSTLSLVIAAAAVGMSMGIIDNTMNTALILAAVVTVVTSPIVFQRLVPDAENEQATQVGLVGFNAITMKLAQELHGDGYNITMYGSNKNNLEPLNRHPYRVVEVDSGSVERLEQAEVFDKDIVVFFTNDDERNFRLAQEAADRGIKQVIARVEGKETPEDSNIDFVSSFFSNMTVVKALIEFPSVINLVTDEENLHEIVMLNERYHMMPIRDLAILGNSLVLRILRGNEVIIPHGDTVLQLGDRLIISDNPEHAQYLRMLLSD